MDTIAIRDFICAKVSKNDDYSKQRCLEFLVTRHKLVYDSYDWKAAQFAVEKDVTPADGGSTEVVAIPELDHVTSVSLDGELLDPISTSFALESPPAEDGKPKHYDEFYDPDSGTRYLKLYPSLEDDDTQHILFVLGKRAYDANSDIPNTHNAIIAYTLGDMWEYMQQIQKAQAKFQEAQGLLQIAQQSDNPPLWKPRRSKNLTPTGNSLGELTDSVCDIIGRWEPDLRISIKERIRRNYQTIINACPWPDMTVIARVTVPTDGQVVLPYYFDNIIGVRSDQYADSVIRQPYAITYSDSELWFGLKPEIFEEIGVPVTYTRLPAVGVAKMPPYTEPLGISRGTTGGFSVFVKGFSQGRELLETVVVPRTEEFPPPDAPVPGPGPDPVPSPDPVPLINEPHTIHAYETPITIAKGRSKSSVNVFGRLSRQVLVTLLPNESERKHLRIWLKPTQALTEAQRLSTVLVLGKQRVSQLWDDNDTAQIRNCENILIDGAAADVLFQLGQSDQAQILRAKADAAMLVLIGSETKQSTYRPRVLPYLEPAPYDLAI